MFVKVVIFKGVMSVSTAMSVMTVIGGGCICYIAMINRDRNHI